MSAVAVSLVLSELMVRHLLMLDIPVFDRAIITVIVAMKTLTILLIVVLLLVSKRAERLVIIQ
jgi:hypothetical protein